MGEVSNGPRIGELFAGYGGLGLAFKSIFPDTQVSWVSDIEPGPNKVLAHRYPNAANIGDITRVNWSQLPAVDIITGGSPCQDLSHAGKQAGMREGTRSGLWASMHRAINTLRPSLVVWENVRGAYSASADSNVGSCALCVGHGRGKQPLRALGRVLGDLSEIGYDSAWTGLYAADAGAPHGRFRVFVLAWRRDAVDSDLVSTWRSALTPPPPATPSSVVKLLPTTTTRDAAASGGSTPSDVTLTDAVVRTRMGTVPNPRHAHMTPIKSADLLPTPTTAPDTGNGHARNLGKEVRLAAAQAAGSSDPDAIYGRYAAAVRRWEDVSGMPAMAPTEATGKGGASRLSPEFTEWMMGLERGWVTGVPGITRAEALKLCGNGVVPQQAAMAIRELLSIRASAMEHEISWQAAA